MAYERTVWKNREVERPRTFEKIENPDGTITLVPAEGNIIEPGTPIIAENMNNIEQGIEDAHDLAQQAFQSASDGKILISGAITGKGVPTAPDDTFQQMANNIDAIETDKTGDATAIASDIRVGKTAYARGVKLTGTMVNNGAISKTITTQGGQIVIPKGYHNGSGIVKALFANLVAGNIKKGVSIGGIEGSYDGPPIVFDMIRVSEATIELGFRPKALMLASAKEDPSGYIYSDGTYSSGTTYNRTLSGYNSPRVTILSNGFYFDGSTANWHYLVIG